MCFNGAYNFYSLCSEKKPPGRFDVSIEDDNEIFTNVAANQDKQVIRCAALNGFYVSYFKIIIIMNNKVLRF